MKQHLPGIYPMYHTEKILKRQTSDLASDIVYEKREVTLSSIDKISKGDSIKYRDRFDLTFKVIDIIEEREAKGNHKQPTLFYNLVLEFKQ